MKKQTIRSKQIKESLEDFENLSSTIKENTESAVKALLGDTVKESLNNLLESKDDEEPEVEEEEVKDTKSSDESADESGKDDEESSDDWKEFDEYKVGDDEYDFSDAKEEDVAKMEALLGDGDQILVKLDGDKVSIEDNERNTEYTIDLEDGTLEEEGEEFIEDGDDEFEIEVDDDDDESEDEDSDDEIEIEVDELAEGLMREYDSHVGYTDDYQSKTAMTTPSNDEPGKGNDWDAGIPKGTKKPWAGSISGKGKPFNESDESFDEDMEEATNVGGFVQQNSTSKSHIPTSNGRDARNASKGGVHVKGTVTPRYDRADESIEALKLQVSEMKKQFAGVKEIMKENKALKKALKNFKQSLQEAAVTNYSLGKIINLISENATTSEEKRNIIKRFGNEVHSIDDAKNLYESISSSLDGKSSFNINEDKKMSVNNSAKLNETKIYTDPSVQAQIELMHRMDKCK